MSVRYKGEKHDFSEKNITLAMEQLLRNQQSGLSEGLIRTNEKVYELLTLGTSLTQTLGMRDKVGDKMSYPLTKVDLTYGNRAKQAYSPSSPKYA